MSNRGDFEAPVLAPEGPSEVGDGPVGLRPDAPRRALREVEEPDRDRRRDHRRPQRLHRALRQVHLDGRPRRARRDAAAGSELGAPARHRRARARHARPHHPRRPGLAAGRAHLGRHRARPRGLARPRSPASSRGKVDTLLMRFVDLMFALPGLVLAIVIAGLLGPNRRNAMIAIGIVITPAFARVVRGARARGDGLPVRRVGAGARLVALADHGAPRAAEHRGARHRARDRLPLHRDPHRGRAQLPRPRHAAAGGVVGRHALERPLVPRDRSRGCRSSPGSRS